LKNALNWITTLIADSRREIIGGLVVAILIFVVPQIVDTFTGISIDVPLIAVPIGVGALFLVLAVWRTVIWARRVNSRLRILENEAESQADSLKLIEGTISISDAVRAAEGRGWKVEIERSESEVKYEMTRSVSKGGEVRIGGGLDFGEEQAAQRDQAANERLLASMILSSARRDTALDGGVSAVSTR
jgi:signal transduction histidine kinase